MDAITAIEFREPLLLLLAVLAVPLYLLARRAPGRVVFSSLGILPAEAGGWRRRFAWVPDVMLCLALIALVVALAGPRIGERFSRIHREGIAIMMVVDVSSSMRALDLSTPARERTRLEAVQDVFEAFVLGGGDLAGRPDDTVGLVSFAGFADTAVPLTLDHNNLAAVARDLSTVRDRTEDGTAIGDALALAVERLRESTARSRIAVVLTDGVNNAGVESPAAAAELARSMGVRVYTIGAGTTGLAPVRMEDRFGRSILRSMRVEVDEAVLQQIAEVADGRYFRAEDAEGLERVYAEIDRLERTRITEDRFPPVRRALCRAAGIGAGAARGRLAKPRHAVCEAAVMDFAAPHWVHLAWPVLAAVVAAGYFELRTGETLARFMSVSMQARLAWRQTRARRIARLALFSLTLALGVVALMRPQSPTGTEVLSQNITADIVIVLDVSKSMLAEDAAPNRLARAKAEINELLERVDGQRRGPGRVCRPGGCQVTADVGLWLFPSRAARCGCPVGVARRDAHRRCGSQGDRRVRARPRYAPHHAPDHGRRGPRFISPRSRDGRGGSRCSHRRHRFRQRDRQRSHAHQSRDRRPERVTGQRWQRREDAAGRGPPAGDCPGGRRGLRAGGDLGGRS